MFVRQRSQRFQEYEIGAVRLLTLPTRRIYVLIFVSLEPMAD
jgi:hypothetical protein